MQRPDLQAIANEWINALEIQDRSIVIAYTPNLINPANGDVVYGLMTILDRPAKRFRIDIQDPSTWPVGAPLPPTLRTITRAVRHECIHIRVNDFTPDDPTDADIQAEEEAVWAIEGAFDRITNAAQPRIAAMVVKQPQTLAQVAGQIRAMTATAATRRTKGMSMDAKAVLAAIKDQDEAAALAILEQWLTEQISGAAEPSSVPDPNAPPMGAGVGNVPSNEPSKDKMPPDAMRAMAAEVTSVRAMGVEVRQLRDELKAAADIVRPSAKVELVRAMRADGIALSPHQEKRITDAPTIEVAKDRAETMRAMAPVSTRKDPAKPPGDDVGLTAEQATKYRGMVAANNPRAESWRDETIRANSKAKKGSAK